MLFQDENDAFLRNNVNKHRSINVILTVNEKLGCKAFHLYDVADIKLSVQSSLICRITEISEKKHLLA